MTIYMVPLIALPFAGIALVVGQFAVICQSQVNEFWSLSQPFKGGQFLGLQNFILAREADDRTIFEICHWLPWPVVAVLFVQA